MNKKYFSFAVIFTALVIFAILPVSNYIADPSRTLHHDYKTRYLKYHPHKLFLKTDYLLDNKNKFDTLVYGSSRGGFIDVSRISKNAYNMSHGFGTVTTYLHSLKNLLDNGVKVKNVWIGINDFVIWKDHTKDLHRLINHNSILLDIRLYIHWLFRFIPESIRVFQANLSLMETKEITDPSKRIIRARKQEKLTKGKKYDIPAATLGYTEVYRIDEAVNEVQQIKKLCEIHDINLTIFMYPIYYKTYLKYNQNKIEEFKYKLSSVVNFYDFYDLSDISINQDNWFEGSHFVPSVGDYMIDNIKKNQFLVTKENVNERIHEARAYLKNISKIPLMDFNRFLPNTNINMDSLNIIFDINDESYTYTKNNHFTLSKEKECLSILVKGEDPMFILDSSQTKSAMVVFTFVMESSSKSVFEVFFKKDKKEDFSPRNKYRFPVKKGLNEFRFIMSGNYINNGIRVDFTKNIGKYKIKKFIIREL